MTMIDDEKSVSVNLHPTLQASSFTQQKLPFCHYNYPNVRHQCNILFKLLRFKNAHKQKR